jgi:hypothetical protein
MKRKAKLFKAEAARPKARPRISRFSLRFLAQAGSAKDFPYPTDLPINPPATEPGPRLY